ncbi:hypothetical protein RJ641_004940 [Dillenia turbinata]|uniref:Uncharacterized protein n=1 Tax=Dillenia turbinata TaxID=194707 RepID=A0AAN8V706_9MAGN
MDAEEQEALFHSYPCAVYYVQSPSTLSHANSADCRNINSSEIPFHLPFQSDTFINTTTNHTSREEASHFTLSRYSSSRGSNNSFLHEKKIVYDLQSHGGEGIENGEKLRIIGGNDCRAGEVGDCEDDDDEIYGDGKVDGWWRYFTFRNSSSCAWISLQISWRFLVSVGVALLVFYVATKPPPPKISIQLLQGPELYAGSDETTSFRLFVGTKNKAMYGAGRSMEDMLESGQGLPLLIRMSLSSHFRVVRSLIQPKFHHQAQCSLLLSKSYDKKHRTQVYNSTCTAS